MIGTVMLTDRQRKLANSGTLGDLDVRPDIFEGVEDRIEVVLLCCIEGSLVFVVLSGTGGDADHQRQSPKRRKGMQCVKLTP
jgi:hypothetical protein